jgi:hypothetical protein
METGLLFEDYGSLLSAGELRASNPTNGGACLEIGLEPSVIDGSSIILFDRAAPMVGWRRAAAENRGRKT